MKLGLEHLNIKQLEEVAATQEQVLQSELEYVLACRELNCDLINLDKYNTLYLSLLEIINTINTYGITDGIVSLFGNELNKIPAFINRDVEGTVVTLESFNNVVSDTVIKLSLKTLISEHKIISKFKEPSWSKEAIDRKIFKVYKAPEFPVSTIIELCNKIKVESARIADTGMTDLDDLLGKYNEAISEVNTGEEYNVLVNTPNVFINHDALKISLAEQYVKLYLDSKSIDGNLLLSKTRSPLQTKMCTTCGRLRTYILSCINADLALLKHIEEKPE